MRKYKTRDVMKRRTTITLEDTNVGLGADFVTEHKSRRAGAMDNRPKRRRTRGAAQRAAIREYS